MQSFSLMIAGVDEVGRGPLAGPVYAAAVILNPHSKIHGLADSKLLTRERREELDAQIRAGAIAWSLGVATVEEIDRINILQASLLAMQRAVAVLSCVPCLVLVDGNRCPQLGRPSAAIIKGDQRVNAISAASIVAKVARDQQMRALDLLYPDYGFAGHKGYPTPAHLHALQTLGVSPIHRRTFAPVRQLISAGFQAAPFCAELQS
ncbi:MAG: ribonuclease HII [Gammaproteobacteria bacterium]